MNDVALLGLLRRARRVSAAEWRDLGAARFALWRAAVDVRIKPRGHFVSPSDASPEPPPDAAETYRATARSLALAVDRAARLSLRSPSCLVRAVALRRLLQNRGVQGSAIRVGVRMINGTFAAHAWVEWLGENLGEPPRTIATFSALPDVRVLPDS